MDYKETIAYLYASQPTFHLIGGVAYKPGLDNIQHLLAHFGNPHNAFPSIHVAGTNGKGSTSHLIAASLQQAGYKVGLYTSPHLVDFRERIRVNGAMIPEEAVVTFVANNKDFLEQTKPSFFETATAIAFWYFASQKIDVAVVEVGLGGRLDSTNVITPLVSVITNIGLDHTEFLGNTLRKIAGEKAGIIKEGVPCVIGETDSETMNVFLKKAGECHILGEGLETTDCRIWFADQCGYMRSRREIEIPECQLKGIYQEKNQQTAYVTLQVLRNYSTLTIPTEAIRNGFAQVCTLTGLRGRWETLSQQPLTICDTGHNGHGIQYVAKQLKGLECPTLHIVFGMVNDKDVDVVLRLMPTTQTAHACVQYYFTRPATNRAIPAEEMLQMWQNVHPEDTTAIAISDISEAIGRAKNDCSKDDIIFIGGSNYLVGKAIEKYEI